MRKFLLFVLLAALVLVPTLAQDEGSPRTGFRPDAPPYAIRGPHPVGFMTFSDGNADRPMEGGIWYPAIRPEGAEEVIVYDLGVGDLLPDVYFADGRAILDAAANTADGPYPLLISSHAFSSDPYWIAYMHEHLASHGFVVMAMNHYGNMARDLFLIQSDEMLADFRQAALQSVILRPLDVSKTLDYAEELAEGAMAGVIDMERVGVMGVSYGGYTAVAAGGGRFDFSGLPDLCASGAFSTPIPFIACLLHGDDLPSMEAQLLELADIDAEPGQLWPSLGDERIDAILSLVGGGAIPMMSDEGLANIRLPILLTRHGNDPVSINSDRVWQHSTSTTKAVVTLEHAGHNLVGQTCGAAMSAMPEWVGLCFDPVWDRDRAHDLTNHFATAFLLAELKGDEDARAALAPDAVNFPGIGYEAVGY